MMKKILFLGGAINQIPPIKYAKEQGHYIITCDYLPDNPGHQLADEYHNISTTDKEAVLKLAKKLNIDAIIAYASDPSAPTQAYVGNRLGLSSNSYESVLILTRKDLFRNFLKVNGFFVPFSKSFYEYEEAKRYFGEYKQPVIVKPIDSSGSKGITKIDDIKNLGTAFEYALSFSREKRVIIEEFIEKVGYQVAGDGFVVNGKLVFKCWANQHNDKYACPFVPVATSYPSIISTLQEAHAHNETQRLLDLLNIKSGALNFEFYYDKNGNLFFQELGPRNGGNLIPEVIKYATDIDLVKYTVDSALGKECSKLKMKKVEGFYSAYMIHALKNGKFKGVWYSDDIKKNILELKLYVDKGANVDKFVNSSNALGAIILQFDSEQEMLEKMDNMDKYFKVELLDKRYNDIS